MGDEPEEVVVKAWLLHRQESCSSRSQKVEEVEAEARQPTFLPPLQCTAWKGFGRAGDRLATPLESAPPCRQQQQQQQRA